MRICCLWMRLVQRIFSIPSLSLLFLNCSLLKALVKMSGIWSSVLQYCIHMFPFSILSLRKWYLTSMCLVILWWTGFLAILRAFVLSHKSGIVWASTLKSWSCFFIHRSWSQQNAAAIYSFSAIETATEFYFLVPQEMSEEPRKGAIPEILFLSTWYPA